MQIHFTTLKTPLLRGWVHIWKSGVILMRNGGECDRDQYNHVRVDRRGISAWYPRQVPFVLHVAKRTQSDVGMADCHLC
jgi:hypothetical protein